MGRQCVIALSLALLGCLATTPAHATLFKRRPATPQLPEHDHRLIRDEDAGAHTPEQVHLAYAGPGAVTVSWVTWPREDDEFLDSQSSFASQNSEQEGKQARAAEDDGEDEKLQEGGPYLTSSRKLHLSWPSAFSISALQETLSRHHRRHRRRRRHDADRNPDPAGNCKVLRKLGLESVVQYGLTPGNYSHQVSGDFDCYSTTAYLSGALHHVVIGEQEGPLPPGTPIYYRVGDPGRHQWSQEMSFTSAPPIGPRSLPYRLGLLGDLGQTEHSASTLEHLSAQNVDSVMFMGDLSYADGYQPRWDTWGRFVSTYTSSSIWMYAEGNHEIEPSNEAPDFLSYTRRFRMPSRHAGSSSNLYYSYEVAGVHILMLGSYTEFDEASAQYAWLLKDLASVDRSRTPWVIVGMHAPWYNSNHNHYGDGESMRQSMEAILYSHGVDAILAGHVHAYERSVGVYNNEIDPCGPLYINIGDAGNREGLDFDYYKQPEWSAIRDPSYGHAVFEFINGTHAAYRWHRNQDNVDEVADVAVLQRDPKCRIDGARRLKMKLEAKKLQLVKSS